MAARGPGRKFKKVPPQGRKPIRPQIKQPYQPNNYGGGLFEDGDLEAFYEQINPINLPKNVYMQLGRSLGAAYSARYSTAALREEALDIEATRKEVEDLPGSSGAGVSVNLKDWLEDPEKQLDKTADSWWQSVVNLEDLTTNAEMNYIWKPLLTGENKAIGALGLVEENLATGAMTGRGVQLAVDLGNEVNPDFYKQIATDFRQWANVMGSRDDRVGAYRNVQVDLLTAINAQVDPAKLAALAASPDPRVRAFANKWLDLQNNVLRVADRVDPLKATAKEIVAPSLTTAVKTVPDYTDASGVVTPGAVVRGRRWDNIGKQVKLLDDQFDKIAFKGGETAAGLRAIAAPFVPEPLIVGGTLAASGLSPEIMALREKRIALLGQEARSIGLVDDVCQDVLKLGPAFLENQLMNAGLATEAERLTAWLRLANFRETQGTAYDFLEAIDGKTFFRTFVWNGGLGKLTKQIPGLAQYAKYLTPGDYAKIALKKIGYFGLTGTFGKDVSLWQPFKLAAKIIEDTPFLSKPLKILSGGLFEDGNFAFSNFGNAWRGTSFFDQTLLLKAKDFSEKELGMLTSKAIDVDDWKLLKAITQMAGATDASGNAVLTAAELRELFSGTTSPAVKRAIVDLAAKQSTIMGQEAAITLGGLKNAAYDHFLNTVAGDPMMAALLQKYQIMDGAGNIDVARFTSFWKDVQDAGLDNRYVSFVTSAGRKLDHYQSLVFERIYRIPGIGPLIKQLRGGWISQALLDPKKLAIAAKAWLATTAASLGAKLGTSSAAMALKAVGGAAIKALGFVIDSLGGIVSGPLAPLITAAVSWIVNKVVMKIFGAIKGPAKKGLSFVYKLTPFHWAVFTDYGAFGSGEDLKVVGCVGCGGCLLLPLFAIGTLIAVAGANMNFQEDFTAASPDISISNVVTFPTPAEVPLGGPYPSNFRITVTNTSSQPAAGVTLTDDFQQSAGVTFVSCEGGPAVSGGTITWGLASLAARETKTFTCLVSVTSATDKYITNIAQVAATIAGAVSSNTATSTLKVGSPIMTAACGWPAGPHGISEGCTWSGHPRPADDINYSLGTALTSTIDGVATRCVITTNEKQMSDSYGIYVDVVGNGYKVRYGHLAPQAGEVSGQGCRSLGMVHIGDTIGNVGLTGKSTGPHVHYEIYKSGAQVCPESYLNFTAADCHPGP